MRNKLMQLNTRGLIAAAIASAASGQALAEQAGRVSFVTGEVTASSADGQTRALKRGDIINGGDKIQTGVGRLQIRFSDGGFVSLQPNTVFGVDQYLYANKPPEETSLFFSLLQGGMRTVTGAIGKVNKQAYKVRTPVATIGIRGTEYLARVDAKRVIVSVGSGFVNVSNEHGNITGGSGQNIEALEGSGPHLTTDEPDINATGPEGDGRRHTPDDTETDRQQRIGDQINIDGNNLILANGSPPVYTYVPPADPLPNGSGYSLQTTDASGNFVSISGLTATFDPTTGAITSLVQGSPIQPPNGPLAAATVPVETGPSFTPGTLKFVNTARYGNIGWGEITDGSTTDNSLGIFPSSVGPDEFYGYMLAVPTSGFASGKASYSLQGASLARLDRSSNSGTLDHFKFDLNLLTGTANIDMLVKMTDATIGDISVIGSDLSLSSSAPTFAFTSLSTSSTGSFCAASGGCSTDISGMFVANGSQVAASYAIRNSSSNITGYAALGLNKYLPEQDGFYILMPNGENYSYATVIQNANGSLVSFSGDDCDDGCITAFDSGTLKFTSLGKSGSIYWGEYTDGEGTFYDGGAYPASLANNEFQAYLAGPQVLPSFNGKASYSLRGGTPARLNGGSTKGTLDHLNLSLDLGRGLADVDMMVKMSGEDITASGSNLYLSGYNSQFNINSISTTSTGSFCGSGSCYTDISGFFSGTGGDQVGVAYNMSGNFGSNSVTGVAALGQDSVEPAAESGYSLLTMGYGEGGQFSGTLDAAFNADNTINYLVEPSACEGDCVFEPGTLKTNAVGHTTYLRWGEYTNGSAAASDLSGLPGTLAFGEFASYIIGKTVSVGAINGAATASYSLRGGTPARVVQGSSASSSATLDLFKLDLNLFAGTVNVAMELSGVGSASEKVSVTGSNISLPMLSMGLDASNNLVDSYAGGFQIANGLTTTSSQNLFCASSCYTYINGFLAGDSSEIGTAYYISGNGTITGTAALGLDSTTTGTSNPLKSGSGYILAADYGGNIILTEGNPANASYPTDASFDASGKLLTLSMYNGEGTTTYLDSGTASSPAAETGTYKTLNWGRLAGTGAQVTYNGQSSTLVSTDNIHYIVGTITDPNSWQALNQGYSGGTATYSVVGNTNPTDSSGNVGTLNKASLTLHLDYYQPTLDVAVKVTMGSDVYDAASSGNNLAYLGSGPAAATFGLSGIATTVNGGACGGSGCSTSVHGFFSGSQAQQAGMNYSIVDTGTANTTITGAAALKVDSLVMPGG